MTNTTTVTWIRRVAAGAVLAAGPALIALGTATAGHAAETNSTSPSYSPTPVTAHPYQGAPGYESSWGTAGQTPYGTYQNDHKRAGAR